MADSITGKTDGSAQPAESTLALFGSLNKNLHTQELKLWDKSQVE